MSTIRELLAKQSPDLCQLLDHYDSMTLADLMCTAIGQNMACLSLLTASCNDVNQADLGVFVTTNKKATQALCEVAKTLGDFQSTGPYKHPFTPFGPGSSDTIH